MQRIHFQQWRITSQQELASVVVVVGTFVSKIKTWHRGKNVNQRNFIILRGYYYSSDFIESHKCWTHFRPNFFFLSCRHFSSYIHATATLEIENERLMAKIVHCIFFCVLRKKKSESFEKFTGKSWTFKRSENEWILMNAESETEGLKKKPEQKLWYSA